MPKVVRIGSGSGCAFDSGISVRQMLDDDVPDYIIFEHMAEGSMSPFARMLEQSPEAGYSASFLEIHLGPYFKELMQAGVKVITNAGGMNPHAAARAVRVRAAELGLAPRIAVITGDDIRYLLPDLGDEPLHDMFSGVPVPDDILAANAYLGAFPIATALDHGADIVISGRVADSALTLGPLIHEFGWSREDYDRLASGTIAGHLLECGTQATGGTFTDWIDVPGLGNLGFPIVECTASGDFVVTKPKGTGGLVAIGTISEQLLYEVNDPRAYLVPDVSCDISGIRLKEVGPDRIEVSGIRGSAPNGYYKVSALNEDGWRVSALIPVLSQNAVEKSRQVVEAVFTRTRALLNAAGFGPWREEKVDLLGSGESFAVGSRSNSTQTEVMIRASIIHPDAQAATIFRNECVATGTNGCPGVVSLGLPAVVAAHRLYSFLVPRNRLKIDISIDGVAVDFPSESATAPAGKPLPIHEPDQRPCEGSTGIPLIALAWARSGDKGNNYNLGVIARDPEYLPYIRNALTGEVVGEWLRHTFDDPEDNKVTRFDVPGLHALNFVMDNALGGGASIMLNIDCNAKSMAQRLLAITVPVPPALAAKLSV